MYTFVHTCTYVCISKGLRPLPPAPLIFEDWRIGGVEGSRIRGYVAFLAVGAANYPKPFKMSFLEAFSAKNYEKSDKVFKNTRVFASRPPFSSLTSTNATVELAKTLGFSRSLEVLGGPWRSLEARAATPQENLKFELAQNDEIWFSKNEL